MTKHITSNVNALGLEIATSEREMRAIIDWYNDNVSEDQLFSGKSTIANWCEYAGRICYMALEKGRASSEYHRNILNQGHFSIYGHALADRHVEFDDDLLDTLPFGNWAPNLRHFIEYGSLINPDDLDPLGSCLDPATWGGRFELLGRGRWASVVLTCSRYCANELIRHQFPGISQLSTRYTEGLNNYLNPECSQLYFHPWADEIKSGKYKSFGDKKLRLSLGRHADYPSQPTRLMLTTLNWHWEKIFELRMQPDADPEINYACSQIARVLFPKEELGWDPKTKCHVWPRRRHKCPNLK